MELDRQDLALLAAALVQGWPGNLEVRDWCLNARRLGEVQWRVLFAEFSADAVVIQRVAQELTDQKYPFIHYDSALTELAQTFKDVPDIVQAIDSRIERGLFAGNPRELYFAALVGRTAVVKAALIAGLEEPFLHWPAQALIEGWGINDAEVRSHLLPLLASGAQAGQIAYLIPEMLEDQTLARRRLIELLEDPECRRKDFVVSGLRKIGAGDDEAAIVTAALANLRSDDFNFSGELIDLLELFPAQTQLLEHASAVLDAGEWASNQVALHLGGNPDFRQKIRGLALPLDPGARLMIATRLRQRVGDHREVSSLLEKYNGESDPNVRSQSVVSLALRSRAAGDDPEPLLVRLRQDLQKKGIMYESAFQGAVSALLTLGHAYLIGEELGESQVLKAMKPHLTYSLRENGVFLTALAQHWCELMQSVPSGDDISQSYEANALVQAVCEYAVDDSNGLALLALIGHNPALWPNATVLQFLARMRPASQLLFEACLSSLDNVEEETTIVAARLLGWHFPNSPVVLTHLLKGIGEGGVEMMARDGDFIVTLAEVLPEHPLLIEIYRHIQGQYEGMSYPAVFRLICLFDSSEVVISALQRMLDHSKRVSGVLHQSVSPLLIRRIKNDPALVTALRDWLRSSDDSSVTVTIPRLLAHAGQLSAEDRQWCETEIERLGAAETSAPLGMDLLSGTLRPVLHCLLDVV